MIDDTKVNNLKNAADNRFEKKSNKVTSLSNSSTDSQYPSAKCVHDYVDSHSGGLSLSSGLVLTAPSSCGVGQSVTLSAELSCGYNDGTISVPDFGGKLAGATVKFKIGNTIVGTGVTNNNGVATCNYTFTAVGSYSVTAVFEGSTDFGSVTSNAVTVVPIDLTVASDKDSFSQVGETATITCTLMNNNGGISGETLSYVMKDANNTVIDSGTGTTDSNGEVELSYTAADAGDVTVTVDCMSLQKTCILHDIIYNIVLSTSKTSANIGESVTFTATVKRSNNNPVSGETVTFKDIENNVVLGTATTNASGVCSVSYSWNHSDSLYIQSMIDNSGSNSINITILQGKINTSIIMKHTDYYLIDANNNGVSGKTVHCSSKAGTTDKITNSNGRIDDYGSWTSLVFDGDSEYNGCSYP